MREDIAAIAHIIAPIAKQYGVERVALFGSRARGDAREDSDYDFLITKGQIKSLFTLASLLTDLEEALHGPVDLVTDVSLDSEFADRIRSDEELLYERER